MAEHDIHIREAHDIHIREAELSDKDAVLKIRDGVYGGRDDLPSLYDSFVKSDYCLPYVAIVDGEIVAFAAAYLVDDKKTVVSRARRVSRKHEGKKLTNMLLDTAFTKARSLGAESHYFTTSPGNKARNTESFMKRNRRILQKEGLCYLIADTASRTEPTISTRRIHDSSYSDLSSLLSTDTYKNYLFPEDAMVISWVPYKPIQSNIDIITKLDNTLFLSDVRTENNESKGMLAITTMFQCSEHFYGCNLDIFGTDISTFKQHFLLCLEFIGSKTKEPTSLVIFVDSRMDLEELKNSADSFGYPEYHWVDCHDRSIYFNELYLFRGDL